MLQPYQTISEHSYTTLLSFNMKAQPSKCDTSTSTNTFTAEDNTELQYLFFLLKLLKRAVFLTKGEREVAAETVKQHMPNSI